MIRLTTKLVAIGFIVITISCNKKGEKIEVNKKGDEINEPSIFDHQASTDEFDLDSIPFSEKPLGDFPFFSLPKGLTDNNQPLIRKFDTLYFAIQREMVPLQGKVYKADIHSENYGEWSLPFFKKSYSDAIKAVGGIQIFDGNITSEEYERYNKQAAYLGEVGSIGYADQKISSYLIRRADGGDVYIQLTGTTASGAINILQKEVFE